MNSIDAVHVAEELLVYCSRFGVPQEILTDQGANFTSKLLAELYRMLHIPSLGYQNDTTNRRAIYLKSMLRN